MDPSTLRMSKRLGEIMVDLGLCGPKQIHAALQNQVIFGGRLGTNLLELGFLNEQQLAHALQARHRLPCEWGHLEPDPDVVGLFSRELIDRYEIIPFREDGRRLSVLVSDPTQFQEIDEMAFAVGRRLSPIVVPQARIWSLLSRHYGLIRELRGIDVEFESARVGPAPSTNTEESRAQANLLTKQRLALRFGGSTSSLDLPSNPLPISLPIQEMPTPIVDMSPLSFDAATIHLSNVHDRSAIGRAVLRYARSKFSRTVLLTVQRRQVLGWDGVGEQLSGDQIRQIRVKLDSGGLLEHVVERRAHFLGPLTRVDSNIRFLRALNGGLPKSAFATPVLAGGRVVNVLYADNGRGNTVNPDVGELLILASKISQSYAALLARAESLQPRG